MRRFGGGGRNRTGVHGFAGRCMTTLPPRLGQALLSENTGRGCGRPSRFREIARRLTTSRGNPPTRLENEAEGLDTAFRCGFLNSGAGKESRTPDLNLGKVALYQLSYSRVDYYYSPSNLKMNDQKI